VLTVANLKNPKNAEKRQIATLQSIHLLVIVFSAEYLKSR
jgi:hypothetical protein